MKKENANELNPGRTPINFQMMLTISFICGTQIEMSDKNISKLWKYQFVLLKNDERMHIASIEYYEPLS